MRECRTLGSVRGAARKGGPYRDRAGYWALTALAGGADDASQLVDIVVASGFVDRDTDPADRRRTVLRFTPKGRKAVAVVEQAVQTTEEEFAAELGATSVEELAQMLGQLASSVTAHSLTDQPGG